MDLVLYLLVKAVQKPVFLFVQLGLLHPFGHLLSLLPLGGGLRKDRFLK